MTYILGIDPGATGGICLLDDDERVVWAEKREQFDETELADFIALAKASGFLLYAFLERAQSFPKMGVVGAFKYGEGYGFWQGLLTANGIGFETVPPLTWQRALGVTKKHKEITQSQHKKNLVAEARSRWPSLPKHSGVCDAALIALYGSRLRNAGKERMKP